MKDIKKWQIKKHKALRTGDENTYQKTLLSLQKKKEIPKITKLKVYMWQKQKINLSAKDNIDVFYDFFLFERGFGSNY